MNSVKHAFILLLFMSGLYFMSFFQRVAVPGTLFNELQRDFASSASAITALGAIYLFVYACSQVFIGMLADRYGGVKVILVCGSLLCAGSIVFPMAHTLWVLYFSRALIGVGASGMYLSIIKETDSLFSAKNFAPLIGFFCVIGYGGGLFATTPFRWMVNLSGWRTALFIVAFASALLLLLTYFSGRKYMERKKNAANSKTILRKTFNVLKNTKIYPLLAAGMINFSIYFSIQATIGPKFIGDFLKLDSSDSTRFTFFMMLVTMGMMFTSGSLSRLTGNKRKPFLIFCSVNTIISTGILLMGVLMKFPPPYFMFAYLMLALTAGFAPVTAAFVKELNPRDVAALSVGVQNTATYMAVALSSNIIGLILDIFKTKTVVHAGAVIYPPEAYITIFVTMLVFAVISLFSAALSKETNGNSTVI